MIDGVLSIHISDLQNCFIQGSIDVLGECACQPLHQWMGELAHHPVPMSLFLPRLREILSHACGEMGGAGAAVAIGREAFSWAVRNLGDNLEYDSVEFRMQPAQRRCSQGLESLCQMLESEGMGRVRVCESGNGWQVEFEDCPECRDGAAMNQGCRLVEGLIHGYMQWVDGGRFHPVHETRCREKSSGTCFFQIDKTAVE